MKIKSDKRLNKDLKKQVQSLRGVMATQASKIIPKGFEVIRDTEEPVLIITNKKNTKNTRVPIFAASNVLKALGELF